MKKYIKKFVVFSLVASLFFGCNEFLDINVDPNNPTEPRLPLLMTNAQLNIANAIGHGSAGISSILGVWVHQIVVREAADKYESTGSSFAIGTTWDQLYSSALEELRVVVETGIEAGEHEYVGAAKILQAYAFSVLVDLYGDVPFSESNLMPEIRYPSFDDGADIYEELFDLIDEGIEYLSEDTIGLLTMGADDIIYRGNKENWVRAGNTLKLKLYNQMRLVRNVSTEVNALLSEPLIQNMAQDFQLPYGTSTNPENRNPGFLNDYNSATKSIYISPWFYETLQGYRDDIFSEITDPRIPYYWYNQLTPTGTSQNPTEYRDGAFVSIYFGSTGPNRDHAQDNSQTLIGLYPVGGKFDDGEGGVATADEGTTPNVAQRLLTYTDRLFIEAELAATGVITGDPKEKLEAAMTAAFGKVNQIAALAGVPAIAGDDRDDYIDAVLSEYDAASATKKFEIIMTQKWIASFGNAVETYNDYRRTGYPRIFDPNEDGIPWTIITRSYPLSLPYPQSELELNPNSPSQKNITEDRVFWDVE
jgi:hypothetical protein